MPFLPHKKVTEPPAPAPPPATPSPDYDSLLRRSRNLLDRKSDTTPEGRREANALALELELMNPAPAKPRKDFFGRTVALVRHLRARQSKKSATAARPSPPPAASPNKVSAPPPSSLVSAPAKPAAAQFPASPPATPQPELCSSGRGVAQPALPPAKVYPLAAKVYPQDELLPPSKDALSPVNKVMAQSSTPPPKQEVPAAPIPGFTLTRDGHSIDWYAPVSGSSPGPNPVPSRHDGLKQPCPPLSNSS